jgi:hypothetical protein
MRGVLVYGAILAGMTVARSYGQAAFDSASFQTTPLEGIRVYEVSAFSGYSTSAYPAGSGQIPLQGASSLGGDASYGGSARVGWQHHRQRTDFSLTYTGTYAGMARYSGTNAYNQSLSLSLTRNLSPKWTLSLSGTASDITTVQFLYQPSAVGALAQVPATMDDLAAAFSVGQFSSNQIASALTGAPLLDSPARTLLFGDRILAYSSQVSLNYTRSSRLSFHLAGFTAGGQQRLGGSTAPEPNYVMPRTIGINGGMGMSYMLSPRTQVGLDFSGDRISNRYQGGYVTTAGASIGRKMSTHWFLSVHGGGSLDHLTSQLYGTPKTTQAIWGGSIGFRTYQHTLVGSYDHTSRDTYGLAIGTTTMLTATWNWHRPGSRWSVFTSYSQQQLRNTGYSSLSGWEATGGVTQNLSSHTRMSVQYAYLSNAGNFLGNISNLAIQSVRVSMSWMPQLLGH